MSTEHPGLVTVVDVGTSAYTVIQSVEKERTSDPQCLSALRSLGGLPSGGVLEGTSKSAGCAVETIGAGCGEMCVWRLVKSSVL